MPGTALQQERRNDVELAVMKTLLDTHLVSCHEDNKVTNFRLNRIEKGILATLGTLLIGGATTIAFLARIVLHLGG